VTELELSPFAVRRSIKAQREVERKIALATSERCIAPGAHLLASMHAVGVAELGGQSGGGGPFSPVP